MSGLMSRSFIIGSACFQLVWLTAILAEPVWWSVAMVTAWFWYQPPRRHLWSVIVLISCCGLVIDAGLTITGWFEFSTELLMLGPVPVSLVVLWLAFSRYMLLLLDVLHWPRRSLGLLFMVAGPLSYLAAQKLEVLHINWADPLAGVFMIWWFLLPVMAVGLRRIYV